MRSAAPPSLPPRAARRGSTWRRLSPLLTLAAALGAAGPARAAPPAAPPPQAPRPAADAGIEPLLRSYCVGCHGASKQKGGLDLEGWGDGAGKEPSLETWLDLAARVRDGDMPPEEARQPTPAERARILDWIDGLERRTLAARPRDPGRVTVRRLNRAEYDRTVRDLLGVDLRLAESFPADDVGYGFDNIGDVLSLPPVLIERYLDAAETIAERAIVADVAPKRRREAIAIARLSPAPPGSFVRRGALVVGAPAGAPAIVGAKRSFPADGTYVFTVKAAATPAVGRARLALRVDGRDLAAFVLGRRPRAFVARLPVARGARRVELALLPPEGAEEPALGRARARSGAAILEELAIDGPLPGAQVALPESHRRLIPRAPGEETWRQDARALLAPLVRRAYRRPERPEEVERLARLVEAAIARGEPFEKGMQLALRAVLVSPHFLFRVERAPDGGRPPEASVPAGAQRIDDFALASRLSYFLWSTMPDDALFARAAEGRLHEDAVLEAEIRRMLKDPKATALVEGFGMQWLQLRGLAAFQPSPKLYPAFDDELRRAMLKETELFLRAVVQEDLPIRALIDADFTYVNERLARHYGLAGVEGAAFRRVRLAGGARGGVLTQASVLAATSNPTRTSPVKRGAFILEQILGTPPPPPPPNVPELPQGDDGPRANAATVRELLEAHRKDPGCASCHRKMDPLGFGLETFDAIGAARTHDGDAPVDATGTLPDGRTFEGPTGLKQVLLGKQEGFRRALATKLLTYALGRGTEAFDRPTIDEIAAAAARGDGRFSSLVIAIAKSPAFRLRRADGPGAGGAGVAAQTETEPETEPETQEDDE